MRKLALLVISLAFMLPEVYSQCCAAGNPISADGANQGSGKKMLTFSAGYRHSYSDTYYVGNKVDDYVYFDNSFIDFFSLSASYGITDKIKVKYEQGYFTHKYQEFDAVKFSYYPDLDGDGKPDLSRDGAPGLGDGTLEVRYSLLKNTSKLFELAPSVRVTFPYGKFDKEVNNVILPCDVQPSSGAFKYNAGIFIYKGLMYGKMAVYGMASFEYSDTINTERTTAYKYGNVYLFSLFGSYKILKKPNMVFILQVRDQIRQKSMDKGKIIEASGGSVIYVVPQLSISYNDWNLSTMVDLPVYRQLNGPQLGNKYAVMVNVSKTLNLCKLSKDAKVEKENKEEAAE